MKELNEGATVIFNRLLSKMKNGYAKVDNSDGVYMPVVVEVIYRDESYTDISIAHYYEQNGDLMADPEMCFAVMRETGLVYPHYFKQASLGYEREYSFHFEDGIPLLDDVSKTRLQYDLSEFGNIWMNNIKEQQEL